MSAEHSERALEELASVLGVTRSYWDGTGQARRACDDAVVAVVRALGAPIERLDDAPDALLAVRERMERATPAHVVRAGHGSSGIVVQGLVTGAPAKATIVLESTETVRASIEVAGDGAALVRLPPDLPVGHHRLDVEAASVRHVRRVLVPPSTLPRAPKGWGLFAPLYALRGEADAMATYGDLARLAEWMTNTAPSSAQARDTAWLGTLPLLACYFEEPFEPSPYSPISRAFWSELYVDPARAPEGEGIATGAPAGEGLVDYRLAMRERRKQIEQMLASLDRRGGSRRDAFEGALEEDDELCRYAAFRACVEREGGTWERWPARERDGALRPGSDFDGESYRYHAYAQWLAREQIARVADDSPAGLYLDLPLGSHGGGYDTWRHASEYARGISVGAPPDAVFEGGQDWGFPPMHPERARASGYTGLRAALAHHFAHASMLRIDHVMSLHRLFWIPEGFGAADGVYVRYPEQELWSVLAIEASRGRGGRGSAVVGEDLGTVPDEVRAEIAARGALRMYVVPFELRGEARQPLAPTPEASLACLGTHDMEPFASWWAGASRPDLAAFVGSDGSTAAALRGLLAWLSSSEARVVLANLEDFWLETERQNLPGTEAAATNWKRRFARGTESFMSDENVRALVRALRGEP